eukprot:COSAG02_NODE_3279_length_7026_cov_21.473798_9_plen_121_part_00
MLCVTAAMSTTVAPNANTPTHVAELTMLVQLAVGNEQRAPHRGLQDNSVILTDGNYRDVVAACLAESDDGNCPIYGHPRDWDTSSLTTMESSVCIRSPMLASGLSQGPAGVRLRKRSLLC